MNLVFADYKIGMGLFTWAILPIINAAVLLLFWEGYACSVQAQTQESIWSETYEFRLNLGALKSAWRCQRYTKKGVDHEANTLPKNHVGSLGTTATRKGKATT